MRMEKMLVFFVLVFSLILSACTEKILFSSLSVGDTIEQSDLIMIKVSDNCLISCTEHSKVVVYRLNLEDRDEDIHHILDSGDTYEVICGYFTYAYFDNQRLILRYQMNEEQKVLIYLFDKNERLYCNYDDLASDSINEYNWFKLSEESYVETEYVYVATGKKEELEKLKNELFENKMFGYYDDIDFCNGKYYLAGNGVSKYSVYESLLCDHFDEGIRIEGLLRISRDCEVEIRIIGYADMTETKEYYRIKNGVFLDSDVNYVKKTFSWKIFGYGY